MTQTATQTLAQDLRALGACADAVLWAETQPSLDVAWRACTRGDWMLWLAGKRSGPPESDSRKVLVLAACECARLSLPIYERRYPGDGRVRVCLDTAERWARGEATIDELRQARDYAADAYAASAAAYAAAAYAASAAASAAAYASASASAAASAAAADAAADAAAASAAAADARSSTLAKCADIVRKHYPTPPTGT